MSLPPGTRLGPYEVISPLGAGGMGEVWRARDTRLRRDVAIKVLPDDVAGDPHALARFEREARAAAALSHPNILALFDVGQDRGIRYCVTELLEGATLREAIRPGAIPLRRALDISGQIARGLAAAHEKGLVHRDVKPENIFITKDGGAKLLDFGLARHSALTTDPGDTNASTLSLLTEKGVVAGTVSYMSPEQAQGHPVDHRSDQFSLGIVLYEMLAGRRPFSYNTAAETLTAIIREEPQPLEKSAPGVPAPVRWIVDRLLAKEPGGRYDSTLDLARDLKTVRDHLSEVGRSEAALPAASVRRRSNIWFVAAGTALLLAGLAIGILSGRRGAESPSPSFKLLTFRVGTLWSARFAPDGQSVLYSAAWEGRPSQLYLKRPETPDAIELGGNDSSLLSVSSTGEMAVSISPRYAGPFQRDGTLALMPINGGAPREILGDVQAADWAPDGKALAVARDVGKIVVEFPIGTKIYETAGWVGGLRVSPDGARVAFFDYPSRGNAYGYITVIDRAGDRKRLGDRAIVAPLASLAWSGHGDEIWYAERGTLWAISLSGHQRMVLRQPGDLMLHDISREGRVLLSQENWRLGMMGPDPDHAGEREMSWLNWSVPTDLSSDGRMVLFFECGPHFSSGCVACLRRTDGSPPIRVGDGFGTGLSPDGEWIVSTKPPASDQMVLLPTRQGNQEILPRGAIERYDWAIWSPDGKRVFFTGNEPGRDLRIYVQGRGDGDPRPITPEGIAFSIFAVSPDGQTVAAVHRLDRRVWLHPLDGSAPRPIPGLSPMHWPLRWSADGRYLYLNEFGVLPGRIYRFELSSGREALWRELEPPDPTGIILIGPIAITADGRFCAYGYQRRLSELFIADGLTPGRRASE